MTSRKGAAGYIHLSKVPCWPIDTTYLNLNSLDKSTAIPGLNRNDAYALKIPLPPLPEQRRIVAEVERRLSIADGVERTVEQSLAQAERLRQSILKKAFEGRLEAKDPEDEPAGMLLERTRQQKQIKGKIAKPGRRTRWLREK